MPVFTMICTVSIPSILHVTVSHEHQQHTGHLSAIKLSIWDHTVIWNHRWYATCTI